MEHVFERKLDLPQLLNKKSFFLFGARSTGKTTLIQHQLPGARLYDLLEDEVFQKLTRHPSIIKEENPDPDRIIVIDEIQKLPKLLDEAHRLIQKHGYRFLLTGSSARKLKHGGANMLAGRAWEARLHPLVSAEIPQFNLLQYLNRGGLPQIYPSDDYLEELKSYSYLYLREEILAEALVKKYEYFLRFLDTIALCNGQELNFEEIARDAGVPPRTVSNYVQLLADTLLAYELKPFRKTKKRKAISRSKIYMFDIGIANFLAKREQVHAGSAAFGDCFEHFIINEIRAYLDYSRSMADLCYWKTTSGIEVDCIVGSKMAIEIKSTNLVQHKHTKGLRFLLEEGLFESYIIVSQDRETRYLDNGIIIYPWDQFLYKMWHGQFELS